MLKFKEFIAESTDASTKFEGVIVDCWNLKKDLIKSSKVQEFLRSQRLINNGLLLVNHQKNKNKSYWVFKKF